MSDEVFMTKRRLVLACYLSIICCFFCFHLLALAYQDWEKLVALGQLE
jgi:hypothetical protein